MKILTKEEEDAHYRHVVKAGLTGGVYGLGVGLVSAYIMNARWPFFRNLTLALKGFWVTSTTSAALIIAAEQASIHFGENRFGQIYEDQASKQREAERAKLTGKDKFMDWGRENRYKIVGASWLASMGVSLGLVYRNPFLTKAQKLVQARVYAQGLTVLVLMASAAFEISDARANKNSTRAHVEHYKGEDQWMDMVKVEEERLKRKKEMEEEEKLKH